MNVRFVSLMPGLILIGLLASGQPARGADPCVGKPQNSRCDLDDNDCTDDRCDSNEMCQAGNVKQPGTLCEQDFTVCTNPKTCTQSGVCALTNPGGGANAPDGTGCTGELNPGTVCIIGECAAGKCEAVNVTDTMCTAELAPGTVCVVGECAAGMCNAENAPPNTLCKGEIQPPPNDCMFEKCEGAVCKEMNKGNNQPCGEQNPDDCKSEKCQEGACEETDRDGLDCTSSSTICIKDVCDGFDCVATNPIECSDELCVEGGQFKRCGRNRRTNVCECGGALAVTLTSFEGTVEDGAAVLRWGTESEIDNEGFNLLRSTDPDGAFEVVNGSLIPAEGGPAFSAEYTHVDDSVEQGRTYHYLLEDVDTFGLTGLHGREACSFGEDPICEPLAVDLSGFALDHYLCYDVKTPKGLPKFEPLEVTLSDQFWNTAGLLKKPKRLCTPVDKNGEGIHDDVTHLTCYEINEIKGEPKLPPLNLEVVVSNQFGDEQVLAVGKPTTVCVPSIKAHLE